MRILLCFLLLSLSSSLLAGELSTQIHDIDIGRTPGEDTLIFLTSGHVMKLHSKDSSLLEKLKKGLLKKAWLKITYTNDKEIIGVEETVNPLGMQNLLHQDKALTELYATPYEPSILKDMDQARSFFYDALTNSKESQCYNRAHSWTYHWRTERNLYSSKVWLFFTKRYIRKYKFDWWFHVAPMVNVIVDGEVRNRVMDMKYARGPIKLKTWTDIFIRDDADCPVVTKYSDQADYPESGSCFLMKSSMYYYQPVDLEQLEITGIEKNRWIEAEVKNAFLEAFDVTL